MSARGNRGSIRLKDFDYSRPGQYFVTIVTHQRVRLFGGIENHAMRLNDCGGVVDACWRAIPEHFAHVELGAYVIMPDHVHGVIVIADHGDIRTATVPSPSVGARHASPLHVSSNPAGFKQGSVAAIVASFKSAVTRRLGREFGMDKIWQRNYYEHVIRNSEEWDRIHRYIESNPSVWAEDDDNSIT